MAPAPTTSKSIVWRYPKTTTSTVIIGDSQTKHLFQHFDPNRIGTPAFVTQCGACVSDVHDLLDSIPDSAKTVILNVGTNDLPSKKATAVFEEYRSLLDAITRKRPQVSRVYASLILPRSTDRRRGGRNRSLVTRCNQEACRFNQLLRNFCRRSRTTFYLDHGLEWLPAARVLAADGLHVSFEGVAIMASHIRRLCLRRPSDDTTWCSFASADPRSQTTQDSPRHNRTPSVPQRHTPSAPAVGRLPQPSAPHRPQPSPRRYNLRSSDAEPSTSNRQN